MKSNEVLKILKISRVTLWKYVKRCSTFIGEIEAVVEYQILPAYIANL
ncbi:MAG: hypothetical protein MRZ19_01455 [Helicobacter sp.]|nr:hypothetical protein [Helicobacter sp.]MCI5968163.1 hypothetical protein [Helicobacter sp.]